MIETVWCHPSAIIESDDVGDGTRVWAFSHIMSGAKVGTDCNIGEHVFVESGAVIGNRVTIKNGVQVWEGVTLENDVFVGPNAVFTNDLRPRSPRSTSAKARYQTKSWLHPTIVHQGASIGANATLRCAIEVGPYAMIGAGAVVTRSIPPFVIVTGVPAAPAGYVCCCGETLGKNRADYQCRCCGRRYVYVDGIVRPTTD
jgi:UDP-2-acetamido-3-amino-2,3-dideoxy-glucuronate N-acetyltransferase